MTNPRGLESARRAVSAYYAESRGKRSVEDIFLTTSTSEAYSYVFRTLLRSGRRIMIPSPSYPLLDFLADIQDVNLVRYPLLLRPRMANRFSCTGAGHYAADPRGYRGASE